MIVAVIAAAMMLTTPAVAVTLVSAAIRRENSAWTLGRAPTRMQAAGRRIVGFYSEGIEWLPPAGGSRAPYHAQALERD